jgi:glycine cleavage system aminomethyltransferase T
MSSAIRDHQPIKMQAWKLRQKLVARATDWLASRRQRVFLWCQTRRSVGLQVPIKTEINDAFKHQDLFCQQTKPLPREEEEEQALCIDTSFDEKGFNIGKPADKPMPLLPPCLLQTNLSSQRFQKSCYFNATVRWGVKSFIPYNRMLLPTSFTSAEDEYENLTKNVCLWDVACERQVEVSGPDAAKLVDMLTPRPIRNMQVGQCYYTIITDEAGMVMNDPVMLKLAEDRFWFSIADSEMLIWMKGLALGQGLNVSVKDPHVSPLAVQGPKSLPLMRALFGEWVEDLKRFRFKETDELDGIPVLVARSGWSPERGYELYLKDESRGEELWERIMKAGQVYGIKPGCPNHIRRIEGGMLAFGSDITYNHSVLELGLPPQVVNIDKEAEFLGKAALQKIRNNGGPQRFVMGIEFCNGDDKMCPLIEPWHVLPSTEAAKAEGFVTSTCFSPELRTNIAIATLTKEISAEGTEVWVKLPSGQQRLAKVRNLPFMPRADVPKKRQITPELSQAKPEA